MGPAAGAALHARPAGATVLDNGRAPVHPPVSPKPCPPNLRRTWVTGIRRARSAATYGSVCVAHLSAEHVGMYAFVHARVAITSPWRSLHPGGPASVWPPSGLRLAEAVAGAGAGARQGRGAGFGHPQPFNQPPESECAS